MAGPGRRIRVYVDTSVIGGCLDEEFRTPSMRLFNRSRAGDALLVISDTTLAELASAPPKVRNVIEDLPRECLEFVHQTVESEGLARSTSGRRWSRDECSRTHSTLPWLQWQGSTCW